MLPRRIVRTRAMQCLYACFAQERNSKLAWDMQEVKGGILHYYRAELSDLQSTLAACLQLLPRWATIDREHKEGQGSLQRNLWLAKLTAFPAFQQLCITHPATWEEETLRLWHQHLAQTPYWPTCSPEATATLAEDARQIKTLFDKAIFPYEAFTSYQLKKEGHYTLYQSTLQALLRSFIKKVAEDAPDTFALYQEDFFGGAVRFFEALVTSVIEQSAHYTAMIQAQAANWSIDRLPLLDLILLQMGLAEQLALGGTPAIIINEYIELGKSYGGPKTHTFLHGMLDKIFQKQSPHNTPAQSTPPPAGEAASDPTKQ